MCWNPDATKEVEPVGVEGDDVKGNAGRKMPRMAAAEAGSNT